MNRRSIIAHSWIQIKGILFEIQNQEVSDDWRALSLKLSADELDGTRSSHQEPTIMHDSASLALLDISRKRNHSFVVIKD